MMDKQVADPKWREKTIKSALASIFQELKSRHVLTQKEVNRLAMEELGPKGLAFSVLDQILPKLTLCE